MEDGRNGVIEGVNSTDDAVASFAILGNEIRARILATLSAVRGPDDPPPVLSFSQLRDAVDIDVNSSKFNYHLQQLVGHYVERTGDGYRMRPAGMLLSRTIRAGTITEDLSVPTIEIGVDCYRCAGAIVADASFGEFWIECPDCDHFYDMVMAPPATVDPADEAGLLTRLDRYNRHLRGAFSMGICPICMNDADVAIHRVSAYPYDAADLLERHVHWWCDRCGHRLFATPGMVAIDHPTVVTFFESRGEAITERTVWEYAFAMTDRATTVRSTEPLRLEMTLECGGDVLVVVLDESATVVETAVHECGDSV